MAKTDIAFKHGWFRRYFEGAKKEQKILSKNKLLALFQEECLSTERTGQGILKMFKELGTIKITLDDIEVQ